MNTLELREKRGKLIADARVILDKADAEKRKLSAAETTQWNAMLAESDALKKSIDQHEHMDVQERDIERTNKDDRPPIVGIDNGATDRFHEPSDGGDHWMNAATRQEVRTFGPKDGSVRKWLESQRGDDGYRGLRFGSFLRAMIVGPQNDVERRALSEGTDSAGGFTVPDFLLAQLLDLMRAKAVTMRAGAIIVPLESDKIIIARLASDPVPTWRAENAAVAESDPTFGAVTLVPKTLAVLTKVSRELTEDSINLDTAMLNAFAGSLGRELDRVALLGSGTGSEPKGIRGTTDVNVTSMGTNGAQLTSYDNLISNVQLILEDNADVPTFAIMSPRTWAVIGKLKDTTTQPLTRPPVLSGITFLDTSAIPNTQTQGTANNASEIIFGGFANMLIGVRTQLRIEILRERYADNLQYGFLAYLRADIGLAQPKAFGEVQGIIP